MRKTKPQPKRKPTDDARLDKLMAAPHPLTKRERADMRRLLTQARAERKTVAPFEFDFSEQIAEVVDHARLRRAVADCQQEVVEARIDAMKMQIDRITGGHDL